MELITRIMRQINSSWLEGHAEKIAPFFHENMVIFSSDFKQAGQGKKACVQSYIDFCRRANISEYRESDYKINVTLNTAVVSYSFELTYELDSNSYSHRGRDLYVFSRENGKWLAVWRTILSINPEG